MVFPEGDDCLGVAFVELGRADLSGECCEVCGRPIVAAGWAFYFSPRRAEGRDGADVDAFPAWLLARIAALRRRASRLVRQALRWRLPFVSLQSAMNFPHFFSMLDTFRTPSSRWPLFGRFPGLGPFSDYSQSKLCNILFTRELARRLAGTQVTANCMHPGFVATGFGRTYGGYMSVVMRFLRPFMINLEQGMKTQVWLASAPELAGVSGKYFEKCAERAPNEEAQDDAAARKLWEISETLTATRNNAQAL